MSEVLVLNQSYLPIARTKPERAVILILLERAFSIADSEQVIRSQYLTIPIPEIIVLKDVNVIHRQKPAYSKEAVFKRDGYKCVNCGCDLRGYLTLEHLIPKKRWKQISKERELEYELDSFENCVCACKFCNNEKDHKLPEEAGWTVRRGTVPLEDFNLDWSALMEKIKL